MARNDKYIQTALKIGLDVNIEIKTYVIKRQKDFDTLFFEQEFTSLRAITWVASPQLLLEYYMKGYQTIELIVGDKFSDGYRTELANDKPSITEQLLTLVEQKKLLIYSTDRPIHTKLFILSNKEITRVIMGSANLTLTARKAHQINYCWVFDLPHGSRMHSQILQQIELDYEKHNEHCSLFMQDLIDQIGSKSKEERYEIISLWLQSSVPVDEMETRKLFSELADKALGLIDSEESSSVIHLTLEGTRSSKKTVKTVLKAFDAGVSENSISIDRKAYLDHKLHYVPLMKVDFNQGNIILGIGGKRYSRVEQEITKPILNQYLQNIENYINTIDIGNAPRPAITKMYVFEALIYLFTTPFFNEYLKRRRKSVGEVDVRGPRFLFIYGDSQNGKTTFLRYVLKLLSGHKIMPINGKELSYDTIMNARLASTSFPIVFDDVPNTRWRGKTESIFKNYWETDWQSVDTFPQIVFTSNRPTLPEWANTRIKRVEFDVQFKGDRASKQVLNRIMTEENEIFKIFAHRYIELLSSSKGYHEDELHYSREVFKKLYKEAGRELPNYFPSKQAELIHDPARTRWFDLIFRHGHAKIEKGKGVDYIAFRDGMNREIREYFSLLPQHIKRRREGLRIIVENPKEFKQWLQKEVENLSSFDKIRFKVKYYSRGQ